MVKWTDTSTEWTELVGTPEITSLVLIGVYIHEINCYVDFDWKLLTYKKDGQEHSMLAKGVKASYLCCRYCALISAIAELYMIFSSGREPIPCWALIRMSAGMAAIASTASSALIAIRAIVVWSWNSKITTLVAVVCLAALGTDIRIFFSLSSSYDPVTSTCTLTYEQTNLPNILALLICDLIILTCLLVGLCRWHDPRKEKRGAFRLWSMLWDQGVLYLTLAAVTEIPATVFLLLNLNPEMDIIVTRPLDVILVLATTRFYRSLNSFTPNETRNDFTNLNTIRFASGDLGSRDETDI